MRKALDLPLCTFEASICFMILSSFCVALHTPTVSGDQAVIRMRLSFLSFSAPLA